MKVLATLLLGSIVLLNAGNYSFEAIGKNKKKRNLVHDIPKNVSKNVSRKSAGDEVIHSCTDTCNIFGSDEKIVLSSNSFGPLPVTFKIINKNGAEILKKTNEDNVTSKFEIPVNTLESGSKLKVVNAFNEPLFCSKVNLVDKNNTK